MVARRTNCGKSILRLPSDDRVNCCCDRAHSTQRRITSFWTETCIGIEIVGSSLGDRLQNTINVIRAMHQK